MLGVKVDLPEKWFQQKKQNTVKHQKFHSFSYYFRPVTQPDFSTWLYLDFEFSSFLGLEKVFV